jgi:hypothetical protein
VSRSDLEERVIGLGREKRKGFWREGRIPGKESDFWKERSYGNRGSSYFR